MPAVNPAILIWARESAGFDLETAAHAIDLGATKSATAAERLAALEAGADAPTRPLLLRMAKQYRQPLLAFYLSEPPPKGDRGSDFRTLPADYSPAEDALLDALIRDVSARQSMVRATLEAEDEVERIAFIGSMKIADGVPALATALQDALVFNARTYRAQESVDAAFSLLRERAEAKGVYVLLIGDLGSHHTALSVETFRGFALADEVAPFVVINDRDARTAWSFSLLHELTHLFLGQTGVSGGSAEARIEQFCNDVASEILLPLSELEQLQIDNNTSADVAEQLVQNFASERKVSASMVAYKAYRAGSLSRAMWLTLSQRFREHWHRHRAQEKEKSRQLEGGPNYYVVRRHRLGAALPQFVARMLSGGALTTTRAATILGVRPQNVQALLGDVRPSGQRLG